MSEIAIYVEDLGKLYRIGERQRYKALRDTISHVLYAPFRATAALFNSHNGHWPTASSSSSSNYIWSLKNVSFEVKKGEAIGVIGRNGAGKSTLLKILSRITKPTKGYARVYGRVGSLLEVGTGFHPELTGRENIYLNGAIIGMRKKEISRKFDEIVAFAEVEKFIDTPVKLYSSGMYVRLAFAVAAHLEPEILLVDEVLAVGDAAFQKKCLGKMGTVAKEGRTVLFVSHNMQAVSQLTNRCVLLVNGECEFDGATARAVDAYNAMTVTRLSGSTYYEAPWGIPHNHLAWARVHTCDEHERGLHRWGEPIAFEFALRVIEPQDSLCFSFQVVNQLQQPICHFWIFNSQVPYRRRPGLFLLRCEVPRFRLYMGSYTLTTWLAERRANMIVESVSDICSFEVTMQSIHREEYEWSSRDCVYLEDATWAPIHEIIDR
jgi:lipopolysaccharide transport system ATP-binding protein